MSEVFKRSEKWHEAAIGCHMDQWRVIESQVMELLKQKLQCTNRIYRYIGHKSQHMKIS